MTAHAGVLLSTAQALGLRLEGVFAALGELAEASASILSRPATPHAALESLKPIVERVVAAQDGLVDSAGISVVPGVLADTEAWHQWWTQVKGRLVFIPHNLNPASVNYYDYTDMTWFERPLASGGPELIGPYIDFGGADMKVVTASLPVSQGRRALAVAGADLSMEGIERIFLKNLGRRREDIALVTITGKVVASNSARFAPGTRFEGEPSTEASVPVHIAGLAGPPWRLVAG
ncbi:cache domain-containing protein [Arthrobacter sp. NQ7]|uniref:cache domain-containing protein n=1 Tax=Arthrobacter sp. NQ7 TaxID=3032303 RepID=UPI00240EE812|nr:cache domain-containing protein [Arthrobacter sp. NQ7]MDJ0459152.1 cache domain-containing protein [Arthrobacter sp. NQ7]